MEGLSAHFAPGQAYVFFFSLISRALSAVKLQVCELWPTSLQKDKGRIAKYVDILAATLLWLLYDLAVGGRG